MISRRTAQSQSVHEVAELTNVIAESVVTPALTDAMADDPSAARTGLDTLVHKHVLSASLVRVKLWTPQGEILYSDEPRLDGATFDLDQDEREALCDPQTRAEISDLSAAGEPVRARAGHVARGVPAGVDAERASAAVRDVLQLLPCVSDRAGQLWRGFAGITLSSIVAVVLLFSRWSGRCCGAHAVPQRSAKR